jgi:transposase
MVEQGSTLRGAAAACGVAASTACIWTRRWRAAALEEQMSLACLNDRSSRPLRSPRRCSAELEERLCVARRETGWGPRLIAGVTGVPHQTVWKVLQRAGCSRRPKLPREAANRYQWPCPGDLLHMDTKRYARFTRPGHAVTGDRTRSSAQLREQVGYEYAHAIIDDHTRLAYSELHPDERADTVVSFTQRALAWYARHGIIAKRV